MVSPADKQQNSVQGTEQHTQQSLPRLFQFDLLRLQQGMIFPAQLDLSHVQHVLDINSGDGTWAIAVAQTYPQFIITALETQPTLLHRAQIAARTSGISSIHFIQAATQPPFTLPASSFDLINLRFMAGFTAISNWQTLTEESLRLLRPGGILMLTDSDKPVTSGVATIQLTDMLARLLWQANHNLFQPTQHSQGILITPLLTHLLRTLGCENIQHHDYVTNFASEMPAHITIVNEFNRVYQELQPIFVQRNITTADEVTQLYQQMQREMQEADFCGIGFYLTAWGQKPA